MPMIEELAAPSPVERKDLDCVEIYLPKNLKHLSELYSLLSDCVGERRGRVALEGFSIYEVDGVFRGAGDRV